MAKKKFLFQAGRCPFKGIIRGKKCETAETIPSVLFSLPFFYSFFSRFSWHDLPFAFILMIVMMMRHTYKYIISDRNIHLGCLIPLDWGFCGWYAHEVKERMRDGVKLNMYYRFSSLFCLVMIHQTFLLLLSFLFPFCVFSFLPFYTWVVVIKRRRFT